MDTRAPFPLQDFCVGDYNNVRYITTIGDAVGSTTFLIVICSCACFAIGMIVGREYANEAIREIRSLLQPIETKTNTYASKINNIQVALNSRSAHFRDVCKELRENGAVLKPVAPPLKTNNKKRNENEN